MKRSKKAALVLMVPAATLLFASCAQQNESALVFNDPNECTAADPSSAAECNAEFQAAQAIHPEVAPKYANRAECEADFGAEKCEAARPEYASSGGFFMPMMMGYMMGNMLNRNVGERSNIASQPLYKANGDSSTFRTGNNTVVSRGTGLVQVNPARVTPQAGSMVRRGGFGQQSVARTSLGG
ncbi:MAG: DUF1190 domain-containing protein [Pseudomonadota bacterium]